MRADVGRVRGGGVGNPALPTGIGNWIDTAVSELVRLCLGHRLDSKGRSWFPVTYLSAISQLSSSLSVFRLCQG